MSTDITSPPRFKRREPWPELAKRHGRSTRTLDRWAELGIISKPEVIRGKKFGNPDEAPRLDAELPTMAVARAALTTTTAK
jgi:hypothetical protein